MKALLHYNASAYLESAFRRAAPDWLEIAAIGSQDWPAFEREIPDTHIIWHVLEPLTADLMDTAPHLKLIHKLGVGVNTIDLEAAKARGIAVTNMPGANSQAVAEHTITLMMAVLRNLLISDELVRKHHGWDMATEDMDSIGELSGRTVGLVGLGGVGSRVAQICRAFGANVLYTARAPKPNADAEWRELDDLIAEADILSLNLPLTPETQHLINAARLARMKPGAVLINTSRGGLVEESALTAALQNGHLRGAGLDVFEEEPLARDSTLKQLGNVVLTPHAAWLSQETLDRTAHMATENARRLQAGEDLAHRVV